MKKATRKSAKARGKAGPAKEQRKAAKARTPREQIAIFVGTRKGAFIYYGDASRRRWRIDGPHFLGHIINHVVMDPRDRRTLLAAARTGHLGPTIFRSTDLGRTWTEASRPPAFAEGDRLGRSVRAVFWLSPGHASERGVWYAAGS